MCTTETELCWRLIARQLSGVITEEEAQVLETLKQRYQDVDEYLQLLSAFWKAEEDDDDARTADAYEKLIRQMEQQHTLSDH